jgi:hypothetical protein
MASLTTLTRYTYRNGFPAGFAREGSDEALRMAQNGCVPVRSAEACQREDFVDLRAAVARTLGLTPAAVNAVYVAYARDLERSAPVTGAEWLALAQAYAAEAEDAGAAY